MSIGLIVIDVQNDYFKGGRMELVGMEEAATNCRRLLKMFRASNMPIFHIQHLSVQEGATFLIPESEGCEIHNDVKSEDGEPLVQKHYPNSFRDTTLNALLKEAGITDLVVCGAMSHMCVDTTVRAAFDLGYRCTVISDACATRNLEFDCKVIESADVHGAFMASLQVPFATVQTAQDYLDKDRNG